MRRRIGILSYTLVVCALLRGGASLPADIADRVRATVNNEIITQSDIRNAQAYASLSGNVPVSPASADAEDTTLRLLIDQKILLLSAAKRADPIKVSDADVQKEYARIRSLYKDEGTFEMTLQRLSLTRARVENMIRERLLVLRYVDRTFRPQAQVSESEVTVYYENYFVPQAKRNGVMDIPAQAEVAPQLREILIERRMTGSLDTWLKNQRTSLLVRVLGEE